MPAYLSNGGIWASLWPVLLLPCLIAIGGGFLLEAKGTRAPLTLVLLAFGVLGGATGYLTGISREPVVGAVVPAMLTLVGGLALFESSRHRDRQIVIALIVASLSTNLLLATLWGSHDRAIAEQNEKVDAQNDLERKLQQLSVIEDQINQFRADLGLKPIDFADIASGINRSDDKEQNSKSRQNSAAKKKH